MKTKLALRGTVCQDLDDKDWAVWTYLCSDDGRLLQLHGLPVTEYRGKRVEVIGELHTEQAIPYLEVESVKSEPLK
jgi:hypothetical protein